MQILQYLKNFYQLKQLDQNEIDHLLALALHKNLNYLYKYPEKTIPISCQKKFKKLYRKRLNNWPLAYLQKNKEFYGFNFFVNHHTLVPRPDSEILVTQALSYLKNKKNLNVIDIGTGSGCLIISLAKNNQNQNYLATDISKDALKVAQTNARKHKTKIKFLASNLFKAIPKQKFTLILANLPYLTQAQMSEPSLRREPKNALVSDKDGLRHYEKFLQQVKNYLNENFCLLLEIDPKQTQSLQTLVQKYLPNNQIEIIKDFNQQNRLIKISH